MSNWHGRKAVVTGGSSGLGLALVEALARNGADVVAVARTRGQLEEACAAIASSGGQVVPLAGDVTQQPDVDRVVNQTVDRFGAIDLLVNCAGRSTRAAILDTTPDDLQALWDLNVLGAVRMTRACAPQLLRSRGHIVNVGSLASKTASPYLGAYPATKHAVAAYTQQLRLELGPRGVHVLLVCPGPIARKDDRLRYDSDGDVPAEARRPGGGARVRSLDPHRLAQEILHACQRRRAEIVRPRRARMLFATAALSPRLGDWLLRRFTGGNE